MRVRARSEIKYARTTTSSAFFRVVFMVEGAERPPRCLGTHLALKGEGLKRSIPLLAAGDRHVPIK